MLKRAYFFKKEKLSIAGTEQMIVKQKLTVTFISQFLPGNRLVLRTYFSAIISLTLKSVLAVFLRENCSEKGHKCFDCLKQQRQLSFYFYASL